MKPEILSWLYFSILQLLFIFHISKHQFSCWRKFFHPGLASSRQVLSGLSTAAAFGWPGLFMAESNNCLQFRKWTTKSCFWGGFLQSWFVDYHPCDDDEDILRHHAQLIWREMFLVFQNLQGKHNEVFYNYVWWSVALSGRPGSQPIRGPYYC